MLHVGHVLKLFFLSLLTSGNLLVFDDGYQMGEKDK